VATLPGRCSYIDYNGPFYKGLKFLAFSPRGTLLLPYRTFPVIQEQRAPVSSRAPGADSAVSVFHPPIGLAAWSI
jgi:hypothetical protein